MSCDWSGYRNTELRLAEQAAAAQHHLPPRAQGPAVTDGLQERVQVRSLYLRIYTIYYHSYLLFGFSSEPGLDMSSLARAAVAGDERALDLFSSWRPKTGRRGGGGGASSRDNLSCYVGSLSGVIYYLNENGSCMEVRVLYTILPCSTFYCTAMCVVGAAG